MPPQVWLLVVERAADGTVRMVGTADISRAIRPVFDRSLIEAQLREILGGKPPATMEEWERLVLDVIEEIGSK